MDNQLKLKLGTTFQVRLVSDIKKSLEYYRDVLGCTVDDWGHAERDGLLVILQQAMSPEDVRPNAPSKKRSDYPTEWNGPDYGWDSFVHVSWNDIDAVVEDIRNHGGVVTLDPATESHGKWEFKNYYIQDPDQYNIVLGAMREIVR